MRRYVPINDMVLIYLTPRPEKSDGGIVIPDAARGARDLEPQEGRVIAVGAGHHHDRIETIRAIRALGEGLSETLVRELNPMPVNAGDIVLVKRWSSGGTAAVMVDEHTLLCPSMDVLAIIEESAS